MDFIIQRFADGLALGGICSLVALALSLTYSATGKLSLAPIGICAGGAAASAMIFALCAPLAVTVMPITVTLALLLSFATGSLLSLLFDSGARPGAASRRLRATSLITSAGVAMGGFGLLEPAGNLRVPLWLAPDHAPFVAASGIRVSAFVLLIAGVSAFAIAGWAIAMRRTEFGLQIRAVFQDRRMAELLGVDTARVISMCVLVAGGLAGMAGCMLVLRDGAIDLRSIALAVFCALAAAACSGFESMRGAVVAGTAAGFAQAFWPGDFSQYSAALTIFAALLFVVRLYPRPPAEHVTTPEA